MRNVAGAIVCVLAAALACTQSDAELTEMQAAFRTPPEDARPWVYWFWLNGNITADGITADLEAMQRAGVGGVLIMEVDQGAPAGPVDFMGPRWRELFQHVLTEADRLGLKVNMNDDAGWNGSGGPWITPDRSMQKVVWTEIEIEGGQKFDGTLPQPETIAGYYRDIAAIAFPTPGAYRIADIEHKACYQTGFVMPSIPQSIPREMVIDRARVIDISAHLDQAGHLAWEVPAGRWTIMRFGHTSTGVENAPSPVTGRGLECDKLSKDGIEAQFNGMIGKLIEDSPAAAGKAFISTHIDSWENGAQNWTARMRDEFQKRRGYDMLPFLPVYSGRVVDGLEISERFLWDLRQTISDLVIDNYAGHLRTLANQYGVHLSIEAYGGPCDDLPYAGRADEPMGEFWVGGNALSVCKGMASATHTYGKPILGAEAFTADDKERWQQHPATLKPLADEAFCTGVNRLVVHRYALQPWRDRRPGMTMGPWGVHYERTQTWWDQSPAWHTYVARCQYMLRQGLFAADICYVHPEAAPQGTQEHHPTGYDYDNCSAEAVITRMRAQDGQLVMPDGMAYRLLVLPDVPTMTPGLARKVRDLVRDGATVIGPRPKQSPSLTDYPACDDEVQRIAGEVWGDCDGNTVKEHAFGSGKVVWGLAPEAVLAAAGVRPDFMTRARLNFIHRRTPDSEIYFVANPRPHGLVATCAFRVVGKQPWLWWPDTGRMDKAAIFTERDGATNLTLQLDANGSVFVLFRPAPGGLQSVAALTRDNTAMLSAIDIAPRVEIRNAVYGVLTDPQRTRDVRDKVQQLVDAGEHSFRVARLADQDDPALNRLKTVAIEYAVSGKTSTVTGDDNDTVHLAGDAPKIQVEKAVYGVLGDPVRTRDMREKLQHILDTGETSFQVARLAQGDDPAPGVVKTLQLACTVEGRPITLSATDSENVILYDPPSADHSVDVRVDDAGNFVLETREDGDYEATTSEGKHLRAAVRSLPQPLALAGPWEIRFPQGWGAPERTTLDPLVALNEHADPAIRYFSGTATYQKEFEVPTDWFAGKRRFYLDLGAVHVMAAVTINGVDLGTIWKPPYMVEVTDVVRAGKNALTVAVANQWINRMIGDEQLADDSERNENGTLKRWPDWLLAEKPSPSGRYTFTTWRLWHKNDTLAPSGLAGPVTLHCTEVAELLLK